MSELRGYLAAPGFEQELVSELGSAIRDQFGNLVLATVPDQDPVWSANTWFDPQVIPISSIGDAASKLRAIQRNWALLPGAHFRRASLIAERLPPLAARPFAFGSALPTSPLGSWTLIDRDKLLASPHCSSPFPHGEYHFIENHVGPPSRAYLKLWEALTRLGRTPQKGELCLDLGASPGGWTWVLAELGANVIAVDKAPLAPQIAHHANVKTLRESAFALAPSKFRSVDWIFSDVICYPDRLFELVSRWIAAGSQANIVATLKFQGQTDLEIIHKFKSIPGSRLLHLCHNKHELTWFRTSTDGPLPAP